MTDLFENPMSLDGFEFVEFASPERGLLEPVFEILGFSHVANHKSKMLNSTVRAESTSLSIMRKTVQPIFLRRNMVLLRAEWLFV